MLGLCSGCSGPNGDLPAPYRRVTVPVERLAEPAARAAGRRLYTAHCAICHGERADGRGRRRAAFARAPADFTQPSWRRSVTPRRVYFTIREGLRGTPMPSWKGNLSAEATWELTAYLLSVAEQGP
jgi:mono/diheme cytochrome c family protein